MDESVSAEIEERQTEGTGMTRGQFLSRVWWAVAGLLSAEAIVGLVGSLWPKLKAGAFGTKVAIASVEQVKAMSVGTVKYFPAQQLYLSRVPSGVLALYRKCTHVGCVIPWRADDPSEDDLSKKGRFNCPCHGGIFDRYGNVHAGPPPRPLDIFPIAVEGGKLVVDTGSITRRTSFDETQITRI
jgi:cytochrome b6-f complex iron-sulfur subunit